MKFYVLSAAPRGLYGGSYLLLIILIFVILFIVCLWIRNKKTLNHSIKLALNGDTEEANYCEITKHILLSIFTFGIWYYIWIYRTTEYLNRAPEGEKYYATNKLLLCIFVPFYQIYWFYKHGQKLSSLMKKRNMEGNDISTVCLVLGIFIPIVATIIMQDKINWLCTKGLLKQNEKNEGNHTKNESEDEIDKIKQFKDLLDSGVITQEEFDAKKKQLLDL